MSQFSQLVSFLRGSFATISSALAQQFSLGVSAEHMSRALRRQSVSLSAKALRARVRNRFDMVHRALAATTIVLMTFGPVAPAAEFAFAQEAEAPVAETAPAEESTPAAESTAPVAETPATETPASENAGAPATNQENISDDANVLAIPDNTSTPTATDTSTETQPETPASGDAQAPSNEEAPAPTDAGTPDAQAPPDVVTDVPAGETVVEGNTSEAPTTSEEVVEVTEEENLNTEDTVEKGDINTTPETVVHGNLVKVKIADFNIEGKEEGDLLTDEEAVATILSLTTKKKELIAETPVTTTEVVVDAASTILDAITGDDSIDVSDYANLATAEEKIEAIAEDIIEDKNLDDVITIEARAQNGTVIEIPSEDISFVAGSVEVVFPLRDAVPGVYTISGEVKNPINGEVETFSQDFVWGVLTMNADKDVYPVGGTGTIAIGILNDAGVPVCDATVDLTVTKPSGDTATLPVENTGNCTQYNSQSTIADYQTMFVFADAGAYTFNLSVNNGAGVKTLTQTINAEVTPDYVVERSAATRLYPKGSSPSTITIHFGKAFTGNISEIVPADFEVSGVGATLDTSVAPVATEVPVTTNEGDTASVSGEELGVLALAGEVTNSTPVASANSKTVTVTTAGSTKTLTVSDISAVAGDTLTIEYSYDAPDVSPMYYTLGAVSFVNAEGVEVHREARTWGIANDNPVEVPDTNLVVWLRADKSVYGASSVLAAAENEQVYSWNDQSVNARVCSVSSDYPNFRLGTSPDAINFKTTVDFNGSSDNMNCGSSVWPTNTTAGTIFAIARRDNISSSWEDILEFGNDDIMFGAVNSEPTIYDGSSTPNPILGMPSLSAGVSYLHGFDWSIGGTNTPMNIRINGQNASSDNFDLSGLTNTMYLGGGGSGGSDTWGGPMAEVIAYKTQLSQIEREKIESYLAIKYGITLAQEDTVIASNQHRNTTTSAASSSSIGQTFTPAANATLHTITINISTSNTAPSATVYLCDASVSATATDCIAGNPGVGKVQKAVTLPVSPSQNTSVSVQLDSGFALTSGNPYVFHVKAASGTLVMLVDTTNTGYASGNQYTGDTSNTTQDIHFVLHQYRTGGRDYVASNGTVVFDASESIDTTANSSAIVNSNLATTASDDYVYNVHAIAKDNAQLLVNTKSRAESEVTPFLTTEIENTALLDEREFMFVGSTNAAVNNAFVQTDMPASGLPTYTNYRTPREWRVQKNAVINGSAVVDPAMGTFKLTFDLDAMGISVTRANGFRLVVDDNGNFTAGTQTIYPATGEPTYDELTNSVSFTGVSLVDGQHFTLALPRLVPGGVSTGLRAWFRADSGIYNSSSPTQALVADGGDVAYWKDSSGNAYHLTTSQSNPNLRVSTNALAINFNPVVDFENDANDILQTPAASNSIWAANGTVVNTIENYQVIKQETYGSTSHSGLWGSQANFIPGLSNTDLYFDPGAATISIPFSTIGSSLNTPYLYSTFAYTSAAQKGIQQNGKTVVQNATYAGFTANTAVTYFGSYTSSEQNYDGVAGDIIFYTAQNSVLDKNKINSYLAAKYGLTMSGGESQVTHDSNATTGNAVGQIITAKTSARITSVSFRTDSATPNTGTGNLLICTGAITTLPNSTNVANCVAAPDFTQAVSIPTSTSTNFSLTLGTSFSVTAGTQYAILLTGTNIRLRSNSADVYAGGVAFNTAGSLSPQDLYFDYVTDAPDYTASNGTIEMWDKDLSGATSYQNGIVIVGRDDTSGFYQAKSRSQTVTGNPIVEIADSSAVADMEFLAVAGNATATGTQTIDLPAGLPTLTNARLAREWQVQKAGDVGGVNISFDLSEHSVGATDMTKVKLLTDADGTFATGATISTITPTVSGSVITFSNVSFTQGQYFTVALPFNSRGPGGVTSGLKLWTRADKDVFSDTAGLTAATLGQDVNRVKDQSGGGNDFIDHPSGGAPKLVLTTLGTQTSGAMPNYVTPNFQPMLQFCRISDSHGFFSGYACAADTDYMYDTNGILGTGNYTDAAIFTVAADKYAGANDGVFGEANVSGQFETYQMVTNGNQYARLGNTGSNELQTGLIDTLNNSYNTYAMFSMIGSTTDDGDGSIGQRTKRNGRVFNSDATMVAFQGNNSPAYLGSVSGANGPMHGRIGEVIAYADSAPMTPAQVNRIESYLALKYGFTLINTDTLATVDEGAYVLSDGTTVWDGSIDSGTPGVDRGFHNGVAAIIRDDGSDLYTKIGRSYSTDEVLTIALDNNFTAANNDPVRVGTLSDKHGVMWGHSGHSTLFDTPVSTTNTNVRMGRFWKMRGLGTASRSNLSFQFKNDAVLRVKNGQQYVLLESTDGVAFTSPTEIATATAANGEVVFTPVTVSNNRYYTIATKVAAPGGIVAKQINGLRSQIYTENEISDTYHADSQLFGATLAGLDSVGTGTQKSAAIVTTYVDHVEQNAGVGKFDDNFVEEFNGYITGLATGSNYVFKLYGVTTGTVDNGAILWIDKNDDGQLSDDEKIINAYNVVGTSAAQSFTTGVDKRFRVRFKETTGTAAIRMTVQSASSPTVAERELTSADFKVNAPLAMWFKADAGVYDDYWSTKADPAVNNDKVNTWENSALVPNNDLVAATTFVDGTGMNYNDATSASAINFNPTLTDTATAELSIFHTADNGASDNNDFFGYTNGLAYNHQGHSEFVVGVDTTTNAASEMFLSYGYDNNAGATTADTLFYLRELSDGRINAAPASTQIESETNFFVNNVPFLVSSATTSATNAANYNNVNLSVFGAGIQRATGATTQRLHLGISTRLLELGNYKSIGSHPYNGSYGEVIHYPWQLSGSDRMKVNSYLAMKYGLTLANADQGTTENGVNPDEGDYLSSTGAVVWDGNDRGVGAATVIGGGFAVNGQSTSPRSLRFNNDGTAMYISSQAPTPGVYQYALTTPYDTATANFTVPKSFTTGVDATPQGTIFSPDGTKMYIVGNTGDLVKQYTLATAYDVSTASDSGKSMSTVSQDGAMAGITFNNDGTKLIALGGTSNVLYSYTLATAYDVSTGIYSGISTSLSSLDSDMGDLVLSADGTKLFTVGATNDTLYEFKLATAGDISTLSFVGKISIASQNTAPRGVEVNPAGTKVYMVGTTATASVYQYSLAGTPGANAAYSNNITFIATDTASSLNQIKSKSQTKWGVITLNIFLDNDAKITQDNNPASQTSILNKKIITDLDT
jgi:hypothetical protein